MALSVVFFALIAGTTLAAAAAAFIATKLVLARSGLSKLSERTVRQMVNGPVMAGILGYGLLALSQYVDSAAPGTLPEVLGPASLQLIVEVAVLAVSVRSVSTVVRDVAMSFEQMREAQRVLVYAVYSMGLVALAYVLLSSPISPTVASNVWALVNFMAGLAVTYLTVSTVNVIVKRYATALSRRDERLATAMSFVRRFGLAVIGLIGVAVTTFTSFPSAGAAIASLFIAAGFGSIVVGLAAQSSLSNMFAGMVLAFSQPFKIGDAVLFKNEWCWVEDMRLNFTVLKTWDSRRLVVPNQLFLNDSLINYDLNGSAKLCIVFVQVPYETDIDKAIEIMKEEARKHPDFLPAGNLPVVHVMEYNESGISLRLLSNAKDQPTNFQMSKDLLYSVRKEFQKKGIEISYPRRELVLKREGWEDFGQAARVPQSAEDRRVRERKGSP